MSIFDIYETANSGLNAMRQTMQYTSENIANIMTPGYKAKSVVLAARANNQSFSDMLAGMGGNGELGQVLKGQHRGAGAMVAQVVEDKRPGAMVYDPGHPLADANGNVEMSNVDGSKEMLKMMDAVRQYKANLSIIEMAKKASQEALNMTKNA
ncbi:MAG: flagellar basal body protein [Candidatus Melainabacteria bacterium]|nr:flagellar basal body protein [Candidatus Melainabacteria bacterium]